MASCEWTVSGNICFELVKGLPAAFVALVIGGIAAWLAYQQWKVARAKFTLDLFDKRYKIFEATWGELSKFATTGIERPSNAEFTNLMPQAQFLFGSEIRDYMTEISKKGIEIWTIDQTTKASANVMKQEDTARYYEISNWLGQEAIDGCRAKFGKYLDFSAWR